MFIYIDNRDGGLFNNTEQIRKTLRFNYASISFQYKLLQSDDR